MLTGRQYLISHVTFRLQSRSLASIFLASQVFSRVVLFKIRHFASTPLIAQLEEHRTVIVKLVIRGSLVRSRLEGLLHESTLSFTQFFWDLSFDDDSYVAFTPRVKLFRFGRAALANFEGNGGK